MRRKEDRCSRSLERLQIEPRLSKPAVRRVASAQRVTTGIRIASTPDRNPRCRRLGDGCSLHIDHQVANPGPISNAVITKKLIEFGIPRVLLARNQRDNEFCTPVVEVCAHRIALPGHVGPQERHLVILFRLLPFQIRHRRVSEQT